MTRVVLSALEPGMYAVRRRPSEHWAGPLLVLERYCDWEIVYNGARASGSPLFGRLADVRRWLNSADGHRWLDGVPQLGREDPT